MVMIIRLFMLSVLAVAIIAVQPQCAYACSCLAPGTPAEELNQSDAVFLGRVVDVAGANELTTGNSDGVTATFDTSTVWKGQLTQTLTVATSSSSASCGVSFEPGKEYVVYARLDDGMLTTTLCSRTQEASYAAEDIAALGAGQTPGATPPVLAQLPATGTDVVGNVWLPLLIVGVVVVALGVLIGVGIRGGQLRSN